MNSYSYIFMDYLITPNKLNKRILCLCLKILQTAHPVIEVSRSTYRTLCGAHWASTDRCLSSATPESSCGVKTWHSTESPHGVWSLHVQHYKSLWAVGDRCAALFSSSSPPPPRTELVIVNIHMKQQQGKWPEATRHWLWTFSTIISVVL